MQKPLDLLSPNFNSSFPPASPSQKTSSPNSKSGLISSAPVRRYKQYSEDSLQAALKEIMNGQSINRSSMKHNIPARTLRDWMKRLNIKSVFTHHSQKDGRSLSSDSNDFNLEEEFRAREKQMAEKIEEGSDQTNNGGVAFP